MIVMVMIIIIIITYFSHTNKIFPLSNLENYYSNVSLSLHCKYFYSFLESTYYICVEEEEVEEKC